MISGQALRVDRGLHEDYSRNLWEWTLCWISFIGGRDYLYPPIPFSEWDVSRTLVRGQSEAETTQWSMLERNGKEENDEYTARLRRAVYVNLVAKIVRARVAHILDDNQVERVVPSAMADYLADVDLARHDRGAWMHIGATLAQVFGHAFALTEIPSLPGGVEPESAEDAERAGQRVYSQWFSPLDVVDWQMDARGAFEWIVLRYRETRRPPPFSAGEQARSVATVRYRIWFADRWQDWTQEVPNQSAISVSIAPHLTAEGPNPIGRVPVDVLYNLHDPRGAPLGISSILSPAYLNRKHFNLTSWIDDQLASQTFAQLAVPGAKGEAVKRLQLSTHRYIGYNPGAGGGMPQYFAPPTAPTELLISEVKRIEQQLMDIAGMSRGIAEQSIAARPAEALAFESQDKAAELAMATMQAQEFEQRQLATVAVWLGEDASQIRVSYARPMSERAMPENEPAADDAAESNSVDAAGAVKEARAGLGLRVVPAGKAVQAATDAAAAKFFAYEIEGGIVTINEVRASKGLDPIQDGDLTLPEYRAKYAATYASSTLTQAAGSAEKIVGTGQG